ncbi:MAG: putative quinol monooxygenase [Gammaproteobacteria bacterium]
MSLTATKVVLQGTIEVPPTALEAVVAELATHVALSRAEAGCLVFEVVQNAASPTLFAVYEEFSSRHAFDQHQARVRQSRWGRITSDAVRSYEVRDVDA